MNSRFIALSFILVVALAMFGSYAFADPQNSAPIRIGPSYKVSFWTTYARAREFLGGEVVKVAVEPTQILPATAQANNGDLLMWENGDDVPPTKLAECLGYERIIGQQVLFYKWAGNTRCIGIDLLARVLVKMENGEFDVIVEPRYLNGVLLTRWRGSDDPWIGDDGAIVKSTDLKRATKIGTAGYHLVELPDGSRFPVFMARGIEQGAKWIGERASVLYVER